MKLRTLIIMAVSTMLAASFTYAAPSDQLTDDSSMPSTSASSSDNVGAMPSNSAMGDTSMSSIGATSSANNSQLPSDNNTGSNDDMSADTATGDDY